MPLGCHTPLEPSPFRHSVSAPAPTPSALPPSADNAWFKAEVQVHETSLKSYLRSAFPGVRDVEDVVQESYLRVWRARAKGTVDSVRGFLFRAARNLSLDKVRSADYRRTTTQGGLEAFCSLVDPHCPHQQADLQEVRTKLLAEAITQLSPRQQDVIILCKIKNLSRAEAARALGITPSTLDNQMTRAMKRLHLILDGADKSALFE